MAESMNQEAENQGIFQQASVAAVVSIGIIAGVIPALQPILLGGLLEAGQLTPEQIGRAGMVEGLGMLLGSFFATLLLPPRSLRPLSMLALAFIALANGLTALASGGDILLLRGINGLASGVILWVLVGMLTRASDGARLFAIYVTAQAILATALSWALSLLILPNFGIAGGYWLIAGLALMLLVPAALFLPRAYVPLAAGKIMLPTIMGLAGLVAIMCFLAGILALWVYFVPLAGELGHKSKAAGLIVSSAIAVQIIGGLAAIWVAGRWSGASITIGSAIGAAVAVGGMLLLGANIIALVFATGLISFFWMFAPPSHLPFLLRLDPDATSPSAITAARAALSSIMAMRISGPCCSAA